MGDDERYERLLAENFSLREKVRNLEEDIEALHWELKLQRLRTPWREVRTLTRRLRNSVQRNPDV